MIATGLGFAGLQAFWPLLLIAFVGTINPSTGDVSVFLPLEQSLLAQSVGDRDRTALFVRYSLAGSLMGAAGTLLAALPDVVTGWSGAPLLSLMQGMFLLYAAIGLASAMIYRRIEEPRSARGDGRSEPLGPSRGIVYRLAALFSVDSLGGGLVVQSILVLWLFQTFGMSVSAAAALFFWSEPPVGGFVSRRGSPGEPHRSRSHHGVHAPAVEPLPARRPLRGQPAAGDRAASPAQPLVPDGRADAEFLRHGGRHAARACGGC